MPRTLAKNGILRQLHRLGRSPLRRFGYNVFSQNGEDGIVQELFRRLGIDDGWVVEFGAWDGIHLSNTYHSVTQNPRLNALYIEGDGDKFQKLRALSAANPRILAANEYVQASGEASLDRILQTTPVPFDFEFLSIDVDGDDSYIWMGLQDYTPKVVAIEINSSIPPEVEQIHGKGKQGTSFASMLQLGIEKGYACVCHTGNLFFVRNDLVPLVHLSRREQEDPQRIFRKYWLADDAC